MFLFLNLCFFYSYYIYIGVILPIRAHHHHREREGRLLVVVAAVMVVPVVTDALLPGIILHIKMKGDS